MRGVRSIRSNVAKQVVPVTVLRSSRASLISFFRIRLVTRAGRLIEDALVPVRLPIDPPRRRLERKEVRALAETLIERFGADLLRHVRAHAHHRARAIILESSQSIATAVTRERGIADSVAAHRSQLVQAGLFDSRALKQKWAGEEHRTAIRTESEARKNLLDADSSVHLAHDPELAMLLILCSQA
jgi:hypothetical protein